MQLPIFLSRPVHTGLIALALGVACAATSTSHARSAEAETEPELVPIVLREGDELQITFPGAPSLNIQQRIRSDGRITLDLVGEISPIGMTPMEFQERLIELHETHLVTKEVTVRLISRSFYVYINGSTGTKGRLEFDRPVTLLEAVMASGFADGTVNLGRVRLLRIEGSRVSTTVFDLNRVIDGKSEENPQLKQGDMIIVPGRLL